jgi:hypothetical protein
MKYTLKRIINIDEINNLSKIGTPDILEDVKIEDNTTIEPSRSMSTLLKGANLKDNRYRARHRFSQISRRDCMLHSMGKPIVDAIQPTLTSSQSTRFTANTTVVFSRLNQYAGWTTKQDAT